MATKNFIYKIFSYLQLVVFGFFLMHGFTPHHHHNNELISSYSVHFCGDNHNCSEEFDHNSLGLEDHYCCLLCNQINTELHHDYITTSDNGQVIKLELQQNADFTIYSEGLITLAMIIESPILIENQYSSVGLRAPPVC